MSDQPAVLAPIHPGEILLEEFLKPAGITPRTFAERLEGISYHTIMDVIEGRIPVAPYLAHRIARALGTSSEMWVNLQADYDKVESALKRFQREHPENTFVKHCQDAGIGVEALETVLLCLEKVCTRCFEDRPAGSCYCDYSSRDY
jgi:addiction module HigA family antidote